MNRHRFPPAIDLALPGGAVAHIELPEPTLEQQIELKRRELANLEQAAKTATCREYGAHRWKSMGGRRCDCEGDFRGCSVPVYECEVCGACDYGENEEARRTMADCKVGEP